MKVLSLLSTLSLVYALPQSTHIVHESRIAPSAWSISHKPSRHQMLPVRIGLKQSNMDRMHDELMAVADPSSPSYGQHWSPQQVTDFFRPTQDTQEAVNAWLVDAGFDRQRIRLHPGGHWVEVNVTVAEAEQLLKSEYHVYKHQSGTTHIACNSYSVPAHVQPHIDLITPTVHFNAIHRGPSSPPNEGTHQHHRRRVNNLGLPGAEGQGPKIAPAGFDSSPWLFKDIFADLANCDKVITPTCLRALYNVIYPVNFAAKRNSYAIVEYTPQAFVQSDLDLFFKNHSKANVGTKPKVVAIDGGVVQTENTGFQYNGESNLDLQYGMALVGRQQEVTLYQVGDLFEGASFNNLLDALDGSYCTFEGGDDAEQDADYPDPAPGGYKSDNDCGTVKPANVISTSYGYNEADLSYSYTHRQCAEYAKLGMMGVTVVYSSGDFGVAGNGGDCLNPDGSQSKDGKVFNPSFPGTCPYVTSIGATQINTNSSVRDPESACERVIKSGGGFSNFFEVPDYQKSAVGDYFANHNPPYTSAQYNNSRTSRGFPDISANGANYAVAVAGKFGLVYGTSASAPVVGAILTLINDARIALGKSTIGFINPAIYTNPELKAGFKDITSGKNPGCGTDGFTAVPGWDPLTGLGTPNFPKLLGTWLKMP